MNGRRTMASLVGLWLALAGSQSVPAQSGSADLRPIGKIVTAAGKVAVEHASATVAQAVLSDDKAGVKVGDPVYRGDVVKTGADGKLGINFADGSSFNLSSNASMELNEFVYDPDAKSNASLFSLTRGTVTFVAGAVAKNGDMKVDTPVATMGIRGTTPHIEVSDDGSVRFATLIEEGKDRVLDKSGVPKRRAAVPPAPGRERRADRGTGVCRGC
ncbi:FecR family protein [Bradyrhizobium sp. USDA 4486]